MEPRAVVQHSLSPSRTSISASWGPGSPRQSAPWVSPSAGSPGRGSAEGRHWDGQKLPGGGTCVQGAGVTREMCHVTSGKCCCPWGALERRGSEPWLGRPPPPTPKPQTCLRMGICRSREPTSPRRQHLLTRASRTAWLCLPKKDPEGGHTHCARAGSRLPDCPSEPVPCPLAGCAAIPMGPSAHVRGTCAVTSSSPAKGQTHGRSSGHDTCPGPPNNHNPLTFPCSDSSVLNGDPQRR